MTSAPTPVPIPGMSTTKGPQPLQRSESSTLGQIGDFTMRILQADMPRGASGMTAQAVAYAPTLAEVRQGAYTSEGLEREQQFENADTPSDFAARRATRREARARARTVSTSAPATEESAEGRNISQESTSDNAEKAAPSTMVASDLTDLTRHPTVLDNELKRTDSGTYPNGYKFPPKHTTSEALKLFWRAFLKFTFGSWIGFLIVFYGVQVVGWGGMIFILLCGGGDSRACWTQENGEWVVNCASKHTSKSLWIEIDAQVLTALFCVTAFGLAPWRLRDLWHLMQCRIWGEYLGLRKLAAVHRSWFRLPNSHHLDPLVQATDLLGPPTNFKRSAKYPGPVYEGDPEAQNLVPYPLHRAPHAPLTGVRAFPTKLWKMDAVVWLMFMNTVFQIPLCGIMWGQNRFVRPSWATALLIVLGMLSGMAAGWIQVVEGKKIKKREGIPHPVVMEHAGAGEKV